MGSRGKTYPFQSFLEVKPLYELHDGNNRSSQSNPIINGRAHTSVRRIARIAVDDWRAYSHTAVVAAVRPKHGVHFDGVGVDVVAEGAIKRQDVIAIMIIYSDGFCWWVGLMWRVQ
jgi:hypothetical protein